MQILLSFVGNFYTQMEGCLREWQGIRDYLIYQGIPKTTIMWIAFFQRYPGANQPAVGFESTGDPSNRSHINTLLKELEIPKNVSEVDFSLAPDAPLVERTNDMPQCALVFGITPSRSQYIVLRTTDNLTPQESLDLIRNNFQLGLAWTN